LVLLSGAFGVESQILGQKNLSAVTPEFLQKFKTCQVNAFHLNNNLIGLHFMACIFLFLSLGRFRFLKRFKFHFEIFFLINLEVFRLKSLFKFDYLNQFPKVQDLKSLQKVV
jgi:hypothetical protein